MATTTAKQFTELTDYIYPPLTSLHYTPSVTVAMVAAALIASVFLYVITQVLFTLTSSLYRNLGLKERVFWNLAVVRSCFGLFSIVVGVWAIFCDTALHQDVVFGTCPTSLFVGTMFTGFFVFECVAVTVSDMYFRTFSFLLQMHHWVCLLGFVLVLATDAGHFFGCQGLILEMSTPFSCLCWTLLKAGKERSLLWKANQFLLVHTFHLRNVVELRVWYLTWLSWDQVWAHMPLSLFLVFYGQLSCITFLMTPYWTWKKTLQMVCPQDWNFEGKGAKGKGEKEGREVVSNAMVYEVHESESGFTRLSGESGIKEE